VKPLHAIIILAVLFAIAQTMDYNDQAQGSEVGCITDSECEGVAISPEQCPDDERICESTELQSRSKK
jgi:hypothetical protein